MSSEKINEYSHFIFNCSGQTFPTPCTTCISGKYVKHTFSSSKVPYVQSCPHSDRGRTCTAVTLYWRTKDKR